MSGPNANPRRRVAGQPVPRKREEIKRVYTIPGERQREVRFEQLRSRHSRAWESMSRAARVGSAFAPDRNYYLML